MDGWTDGWMDGQTNGQINERTILLVPPREPCGQIDETNEWMDEWTDKRTNNTSSSASCTTCTKRSCWNRQIGWMDVWMNDEWMDGLMDGWMNR